MTSLSPGNEIPSPPLKEWPPASSIPRPVGGASGPPGAPSDTWESVAKAYSMNVLKLISFNFKTNDPKRVNWYLRTLVGCNTPSATDWNWTFKGAKPGIIYIPIKKLDFDPEDASPQGHGVIDIPHPPPDFTLKDSEQAKDLEKKAEKLPFFDKKVWELEKRLLYYTVGKPNADAIRDNRKTEYLNGVCFGIVLGDDGRPAQFVISRFGKHLQRHDPDRNIDNLYQNAYYLGLAQGFDYGNKMNCDQRNRLRNALRSRMDLLQYPPFSDKEAWSRGRNLDNYYIEAATTFQKDLLTYWVHGTLQIYLQAKYP